MSKVWLITGSGSGLGRIIAEAALAAGNQVVATARKRAPVERTGSAIRRECPGGRARCHGRVSRSGGRSKLRSIASGDSTCSVNNAGYGDTRPFEQVPSNEFRLLVETCFFGVVNLTRAALPIMRRQRSGHIIQISSLGGRTAFPGNAAYFASKWAVGGFTRRSGAGDCTVRRQGDRA